MTHDELVEEINEAIADFDLKFDNSNPYYKALRAVVELHKLDQWGEECKNCDNGSYPCETIQVIEEQLK